MNSIIIYLIVGIGLGLLVIPRKFEKINSRIQQVGIIVTLFAMGVSLGGDAHFLQNLKEAGIRAILLSCGAMFGSIFLVYILTKKLFKEK